MPNRWFGSIDALLRGDCYRAAISKALVGQELPLAAGSFTATRLTLPIALQPPMRRPQPLSCASPEVIERILPHLGLHAPEPPRAPTRAHAVGRLMAALRPGSGRLTSPGTGGPLSSPTNDNGSPVSERAFSLGSEPAAAHCWTGKSPHEYQVG